MCIGKLCGKYQVYKVGGKMLKSIQNCCLKESIRINGKLSSRFDIKGGVRQSHIPGVNQYLYG